VALTAQLEAAPLQNKIKTGVFQQTVKPGLILRALTARLHPFKTGWKRFERVWLKPRHPWRKATAALSR
jgi:hypothetical protein